MYGDNFVILDRRNYRSPFCDNTTHPTANCAADGAHDAPQGRRCTTVRCGEPGQPSFRSPQAAPVMLAWSHAASSRASRRLLRPAHRTTNHATPERLACAWGSVGKALGAFLERERSTGRFSEVLSGENDNFQKKNLKQPADGRLSIATCCPQLPAVSERWSESSSEGL